MNADLLIKKFLTPRSIVKVAIATFLAALILGRSLWMQPELPVVAVASWAQAISQKLYNLEKGYYESIYAKLVDSGWVLNFANHTYNAEQNNKALQSAAVEKYKNLGSICYLKGYSDLVGKAYGLSAKIFGWSTLGFAIFFYLWLMTSVALFYFSFAGNDNALTALSAALFSMSCVSLAAPHIQQLYAFHGTRGWTVLTLIPALHIWFATLRPSTTNQLGALGQILLAFPAICVRPTSQWLFAFFFTASFANVGWRVLREKQIPSFAEICGWSLLFIGTSLLANLANQKELRDPKQIYTQWHSVAVGLGMSDKIQAVWREGSGTLLPPEIIRQPRDGDAYQLVLAFLKNVDRCRMTVV